jgi:hypothetical protein
MSFGDHGGAVGYLVGEPHRGVEYMFAMMNHARLAVGLQGLAIAERAYQQALSYARERVQGRPVGWTGEKNPGIVYHPDVRRLLLTMRCQIEAMRAIHYTAAASVDLAHGATDAAQKAKANTMVELLTPIAKGWCTEVGQHLASLGVQVHGGVGYIEETGAAQHLRDARITTIYEGTTAIQANDLINRKILRDKGSMIGTFLGEIVAQAKTLTGEDAPIGEAIQEGVTKAQSVVSWLVASPSVDPRFAAAAGVPTLEMMGILVGGHMLAKAVIVSRTRIAEGKDHDGFYAAKIESARFYSLHILPHIHALAVAATDGAATVMRMEETSL